MKTIVYLARSPEHARLLHSAKVLELQAFDLSIDATHNPKPTIRAGNTRLLFLSIHRPSWFRGYRADLVVDQADNPTPEDFINTIVYPMLAPRGRYVRV